MLAPSLKLSNGTNVVGFYVGSDNLSHGFLFNGSSYTTLDNPRGAGGTTAFGISGANIVGSYSDNAEFPDVQGFLYNGGTYTTLGAFSAQAFPAAILSAIILRIPPDTPMASSTTAAATLPLTAPTAWATPTPWVFRAATSSAMTGTIASSTTETPTPPCHQLDAYDATYAQGIFGNTIVGYYTDSNHAKHGFITTVSSDHNFAVNVNNNTAAIAGYLGSNSDITIPTTIDGIPVTSVGEPGVRILLAYKRHNSQQRHDNRSFRI